MTSFYSHKLPLNLCSPKLFYALDDQSLSDLEFFYQVFLKTERMFITEWQMALVDFHQDLEEHASGVVKGQLLVSSSLREDLV